MNAWTPEQVLALAPDAASASAGQQLASAKKWTGVGRSERALWGLCQGSGKDPYQARIDLSEPAFKCSCPSRKFPCKHGLGLFLLFTRDAASFKAQPEPGWVSDWIAGREERAEKKVEKAKVAAEKPVDPEAQAKRAAQRQARVQDGVAECRVWLDDLVRRGLASAQRDDGASWQRVAARMVDAQAPGLAEMVRQIPASLASGAGWEVRSLDALGRLHLLLCAAEHINELPLDFAQDVRTALGFTQAKEDALAATGVQDRWAVVGQSTELQDKLTVRRTWLIGKKSAKRALVLDFSVASQPLDATLVSGVEFDAELSFYPSRSPLRAVIKSRGESLRFGSDLGKAADAMLESGLRRYAESLAANPWLSRWPIVLANASVARLGDAWHIADSQGQSVPLHPSFATKMRFWRLVSVGGGKPMTMTMEWDGEWAAPLAVFEGGSTGFHDLNVGWVA